MVKVQAVAEKQHLGPGIHAVFLEVADHLFAPYIGIPAVVADAGVVVDHGPVKIVEEQVRGDGVGQGGAVVPTVLIVPVGHGVVIGIGQGDGIDALVHLDELMGIGADGGQIILHGKIHVGGSGAVFRLLGEAADHLVLPGPGQPTAAAELGKAEGIFAGIEVLDLLLQLLPGRGLQHGVVVVHPEIDLVDDLQQVDLKLHGREHGPRYGQFQLSLVRQSRVDIFPDGVPQPQELHIVPLDEADRAQVVQLCLGKAQGAQVVDLGIDLRKHLLRKNDALVSALEAVFSDQVRVLVKDHLIHIEFVQVRIQKGCDNGFQ